MANLIESEDQRSVVAESTSFYTGLLSRKAAEHVLKGGALVANSRWSALRVTEDAHDKIGKPLHTGSPLIRSQIDEIIRRVTDAGSLRIGNNNNITRLSPYSAYPVLLLNS